MTMKRNFTDAELCDCAKREVKYRVRVYWRLCGEGKMSGAQVDQEISMMREIAQIFEQTNNPNLL